MHQAQWKESEVQFICDHYNIDLTAAQLAEQLGRSYDSVTCKIKTLAAQGKVLRSPKLVQIRPKAKESYKPPKEEPPALSPQKLWRILTHLPQAIADVADELDVSPRAIRVAIQELIDEQYLVETDGNTVRRTEPQSGGTSEFLTSKIDLDEYDGKLIRFGVISDNHMCSRYARPDVDNALYDIFEREGIKTVYNTGNWIDGEARFNKSDINVHGAGNQCRHFAKHYPRREGITTYFIAGDDHEGWYTQREGIDVGKLAESYAREEGRDDLVYLGYMEHDIVIPAETGVTVIRLMHPGGGSAYAVSYTAQQIANSLTGGTKPQILILGHYHKAEYLYYRGIHMIQAGCTMDQSPFMRKKRLSAHIGGWIVEFRQSTDGSVRRIKTEWISFFDGAFHESEWAYKMESPDLALR